MNELKTLKDIDYEDCGVEYDTQPNEAVDLCKEKLKQEAIKWVKALTDMAITGKDFKNGNKLFSQYYDSEARGCIIHFFNISSKDLENE